MNPETYRLVPTGHVHPSSTNPRTHFPEEYIAELSESIRARGIIQPMLVRSLEYRWQPAEITNSMNFEVRAGSGEWSPLFRRFTETATATVKRLIGHGMLLCEDDCETVVPHLPKFELIAGECRLRGAVAAAMEEVPVIVRDDLSDNDVEELQLIENLQRRDLDVLEEAASYAKLLALEDGGKRRYTVETLSQAIGKSRYYVQERLSLNKLSSEGLGALRDGQLSFTTARIVAAIPSEKLRAKALGEVLKPIFDDEPMTSRKAAKHIREHYMVELKSPPFKLDDAALVPVQENGEGERAAGGACSDCPFRMDNEKRSICTHPECFQMKVDAAWQNVRSAALKEGKRVLSEAEAEKHLNPHGVGLNWSTSYVSLSDQVPPQYLKADVKKRPSWKRLISDLKVKPDVVVMRDQRGQPLEAVDLRQAVAAINLESSKAGKESPIKKGASMAAGASDERLKAERAAEREKQKLAQAMVFAGMSDLQDAIREDGHAPDGFWPALFEIALDEAGADGMWLMAKWLDVEAEKSQVHSGRDYESALRKTWKSASGTDLISIVVLLFLSKGLKWCLSSHGSQNFTEHFQTFAKAYGIDLAEVKKRVKESAAVEKKGKGKAVAQ